MKRKGVGENLCDLKTTLKTYLESQKIAEESGNQKGRARKHEFIYTHRSAFILTRKKANRNNINRLNFHRSYEV